MDVILKIIKWFNWKIVLDKFYVKFSENRHNLWKTSYGFEKFHFNEKL